MKTQHNNIQLTNQLENLKNNTSFTGELVETSTSSIKANFSRADLWNIQRSRKTGVTYRKHL